MLYMGAARGFFIYGKGADDTAPYWRPYKGVLNLFTLSNWAIIRKREEETSDAKEKLDKEEAVRQQT